MGGIIIGLATNAIQAILKALGMRAIVGAASNPGSIKLMSIVAILALLVGSLAGYYITSTFYDAAHAKKLSDALEQRDQLIDELKAKHAKQIQIERETMQGHLDRLAEITMSIPATLEVNDYVPEDDPIICNVPAGSVGMLDYMRTGDRTGLPSATGLSTEEAKQPSEITRSTEYTAHGQCGIAFRECQSQIESIIEFDAKQRALYPNTNN